MTACFDATDRFRVAQHRTCDVRCGADTETRECRAKVGLSIPIFPGGVGVLLRADAARGFVTSAG